MDRDEVIRLAREAGLQVVNVDGVEEVAEGDWYTLQTEAIECFAALVAAQEREACALQALEGTGEPVQTKTLEVLRTERQRIADAIRARSKE